MPLELEPEKRLRGVDDGRCTVLDSDGCRCLRRPNYHAGGHDFPWTRWSDTAKGAGAAAPTWKPDAWRQP